MSRDPDVRVFIGVDGGGSGCRVKISDPTGRVIGSAHGGAANVSLDLAGAIATIHATIAAACDALGPTLSECKGTASVGLGLAGVSSAAIAEQVRAQFSDFRAVVVTNDGVTACLGAHGGADGGLVVAGTGSVAVLSRDGRHTTFGGRGFLLGDDGSGAVTGREIWRKALRALDGLDPPSPLLTALLVEFDNDPVAIIRWGRTAASRDFARFAPRVFAAAAQGDDPARAVASVAGRAISELIMALDGRGAPRIALVGGLSTVIRPWLTPEADAMLSTPLADALQGALLLSGLPIGRSQPGDPPNP